MTIIQLIFINNPLPLFPRMTTTRMNVRFFFVESEISYKIVDGIVHHIVSNLQSLQEHLSEKEKDSYSNGITSCISDYR